MGLKSIFDGLYVGQLIQKNERGETIIYPHGIVGRGYLLPAELEPQYRKRSRIVMFASLVIGMTFGTFVSRLHDVTLAGWALIAAIGALLVGGIFYYQSRLTTGLEPVDGPPASLRERLRQARQARPTWTYWLFVIAGTFLAIGGAAAFMAETTDSQVVVVASAVLALTLGGLLAIDGVLGLTGRRKR